VPFVFFCKHSEIDKLGVASRQRRKFTAKSGQQEGGIHGKLRSDFTGGNEGNGGSSRRSLEFSWLRSLPGNPGSSPAALRAEETVDAAVARLVAGDLGEPESSIGLGTRAVLGAAVPCSSGLEHVSLALKSPLSKFFESHAQKITIGSMRLEHWHP
jgi:hypothetical protein